MLQERDPYVLFIFDTQTLGAFMIPFDTNISKTKTGLTRTLYREENIKL